MVMSVDKTGLGQMALRIAKRCIIGAVRLKFLQWADSPDDSVLNDYRA